MKRFIAMLRPLGAQRIRKADVHYIERYGQAMCFYEDNIDAARDFYARYIRNTSNARLTRECFTVTEHF